MRTICQAADILDRAAEAIRLAAEERGATHPFEEPLADLLEEAADTAQRLFDRLGFVDDPAEANRVAAKQQAKALRVARAFLGEEVDPPESVGGQP